MNWQTKNFADLKILNLFFVNKYSTKQKINEILITGMKGLS
jgi:hypothetical protein